MANTRTPVTAAGIKCTMIVTCHMSEARLKGDVCYVIIVFS